MGKFNSKIEKFVDDNFDEIFSIASNNIITIPKLDSSNIKDVLCDTKVQIDRYGLTTNLITEAFIMSEDTKEILYDMNINEYSNGEELFDEMNSFGSDLEAINDYLKYAPGPKVISTKKFKYKKDLWAADIVVCNRMKNDMIISFCMKEFNTKHKPLSCVLGMYSANN